MATKRAKSAAPDERRERDVPTVEIEKRAPRRETAWLVVWWHLQKIYCGLFTTEEEANLQAMSRNGVVIELSAESLAVGRIADYWRRDDSGNPLPAEWLTARFATV